MHILLTAVLRDFRSRWVGMLLTIGLGCGGSEESRVQLAYYGSPEFGPGSLTVIVSDPKRTHTVAGTSFEVDDTGVLSAGPYLIAESGQLQVTAILQRNEIEVSRATLTVDLVSDRLYSVAVLVDALSPEETCPDCVDFVGAPIEGASDSLFVAYAAITQSSGPLDF